MDADAGHKSYIKTPDTRDLVTYSKLMTSEPTQ